MATGTWGIYSKTINMSEMTEAQATQLIREMFKTIYNRDLGCKKCRNNLNSGDIMITRNCKTVAEYNYQDGEVYIRSKGKKEIFAALLDWETIYTMLISKWWVSTAVC